MPFSAITHPQKRAFLAAFATVGNVKQAASLAEVSRESHYSWKTHDPDYADAFGHAQDMAADALEDEARKLALEGEKKSEKMLMFLLRGLRPDTYGTRRVESKHQVSVSTEVKHRVEVDLSKLTDEELKSLARIAQKARAPRLLRSGDPTPETPEDRPALPG